MRRISRSRGGGRIVSFSFPERNSTRYVDPSFPSNAIGWLRVAELPTTMQDEIRKAATKTKGAKLPVSQEPSSLSLTPEPKPEPKSANMFGTGETAEPDLISETRENPAATFNTHPGRSTSLKTPPPARKFTLKRSATSTWNFLKGFARTVNWLNTGTTQRDT
ncbi:hypothetical protein B0H67DRAFT_211454 [Lasiosphaeris hirsuta]|uniref:Uncharacterized protein n=1 Tax=Lasiosphaeris hirsuta TaxID=260670 RepID=A0AA40AS94_9PEZI|nr:hypothetical protein B0H67DRAFT_211454 [Lasiosphaeris hirsuta]